MVRGILTFLYWWLDATNIEREDRENFLDWTKMDEGVCDTSRDIFVQNAKQIKFINRLRFIHLFHSKLKQNVP